MCLKLQCPGHARTRQLHTSRLTPFTAVKVTPKIQAGSANCTKLTKFYWCPNLASCRPDYDAILILIVAAVIILCVLFLVPCPCPPSILLQTRCLLKTDPAQPKAALVNSERCGVVEAEPAGDFNHGFGVLICSSGSSVSASGYKLCQVQSQESGTLCRNFRVLDFALNSEHEDVGLTGDGAGPESFPTHALNTCSTPVHSLDISFT